MALDLYIMENGQPKEWIYSIDSNKWVLFSEAFELFRSRSGLVIDQYSDIKFSSGLENLISAVKSIVPKHGKSNTIFLKFIAVLESAESKGKPLIFVGD